ncbi:Niemann-Pick C1 protein [Operophtera brumata]|uniref:Niemann-Pick C1 protein n=1 Tax=Operophtera brumata TaxID=104452 RepID=A0A0L7LNY8_OPEBR|nr:Niemann-Pick C1 protein [Operophtera brumata]
MPAFMDIAYTSERSIEDELDRESQSDVSTILVSYFIMFAAGVSGVLHRYLRVRGRARDAHHCGGDPVPGAGRGGRQHLHPGADRAEGRQEAERDRAAAHREDSVCFFLGALSDMPAVRAFALYAGAALLVDFLLQVTCFVALGRRGGLGGRALQPVQAGVRAVPDEARGARRRHDHLLRVALLLILDRGRALQPVQAGERAVPDEARGARRRHDHLLRVALLLSRCEYSIEGALYNLFKQVYVPFLMKREARAAVMIIFFAWLCSSVALSMPQDSFQLKYFQHLNRYLNIGPPVYFVVTEGLDYSDRGTQNMICGTRFCRQDSVAMQLYAASKTPNDSYISQPPNSWLDDFFDWSSISDCCHYFPGNSSFCPSDAQANPPCPKCNISLVGAEQRPSTADFNRYVPYFLQDNPSPTSGCIKGGHAAYAQAVNYNMYNKTQAKLGATYYQGYHTVLKSSHDYYSALRGARDVAANLTETLNRNLRDQGKNTTVNVFPYSVFYVFYEQYLTMWPDTLKSMGISVLSIFIVTFLLMGFDLFSALVVVITITMIVVNIGGLMYWWGISLNAVMAVGIAVEFCSHLVHSFSVSGGRSRVARAADSLTRMGSSVLSGITLTNHRKKNFTKHTVSLTQVNSIAMYLNAIDIFGSPVNKQKLANQMLRGKEAPVAETSLTRVRDGNTQACRHYNFDTLLA